jgi:hypothetical protein
MSILHYDPEGKNFPVSNIFVIIKAIQKIDRNQLPHAEKNLLISIAIHLGENGYVWPTNLQLGERIGENKDYIKNLLMRLKNKGYLKITGTRKDRRISLVDEIILGNSQLPKTKVGNSQLPVGNSQLPPLIKEKKKKKIKEKSGAAPDFMNKNHEYLEEMMQSIPAVANGQLSRLFVNQCLKEKNGDRPYFRWLFENCVNKKNPAGWLVKGMQGYYAEYLRTLSN